MSKVSLANRSLYKIKQNSELTSKSELTRIAYESFVALFDAIKLFPIFHENLSHTPKESPSRQRGNRYLGLQQRLSATWSKFFGFPLKLDKSTFSKLMVKNIICKINKAGFKFLLYCEK